MGGSRSRDLVPGRYRLDIALGGAEPYQSGDILLAPGEHRDLGTLSLRAGFPSKVASSTKVARPSKACACGSPDLPRLARGAASTVSPMEAATSCSRSRPALGGWPPRRPDAAAPRPRSSCAFGAKTAPIELRLGRTEARIEGLVRDDGGRPLGRARIIVFPVDASASPVGSGTADLGGHFAITSLPAGDLRLEVHHPDYPVTTTVAPSGQFAIVTVPFPGGVAGEVRVRGTGATVRAPAWRHRARRRYRWRGGAQDGQLRPVAPRSRTVATDGQRFWLPPGGTGSRRDGGATLGEASLRDLRFELDPG